MKFFKKWGKKLILPIKLIVSFLLIFLLFRKIGISNIYSAITLVDLFYVIPLILLLVSVWIIGALNIYILIKAADMDISFLKLFKYFLISWAVGSFSPGRVGEFYLLPLLKKEGIGYGQSMAVSILDKVLTFICLSVLTIITFILFLSARNILNLVVVIVIAFLFLFVFLSKRVRNIIKKYILKKYSTKFRGFSKTFFFYFKKRKKILLFNLALTFLKWFLSSLSFFIIFYAFDIKIPLLLVFLITGTTTLLSFIPITMSGLGLRESVGVFLYSLAGIDKVVIFSNYILIDIRNYLIAFIIFIIYVLFYRKD